jgi:hypothetical protein
MQCETLRELAWVVDAERIATKREHLSTSVLDCRLGEAFLPADTTDQLFNDLLEMSEDLDPAEC